MLGELKPPKGGEAMWTSATAGATPAPGDKPRRGVDRAQNRARSPWSLLAEGPENCSLQQSGGDTNRKTTSVHA